jgi:hypothetical protein
LANLEDFHVEYDDENPNYRKVTAVFKKNDTFKNETLVKEYLLDPEGDGSVISKSSIEYHENKVIFFSKKEIKKSVCGCNNSPQTIRLPTISARE